MRRAGGADDPRRDGPRPARGQLRGEGPAGRSERSRSPRRPGRSVLGVGEAALRRMLRTHLLDRGRVVVDLSEATVTWDPVVQAFPAMLANAGGWPLARLVLARPDPLTARILQAARVDRQVPLASTLHPRPASCSTHGPRGSPASTSCRAIRRPRTRRSAVASICEDWELADGLYDAAATVAAELVSNAVEHAGTASVLHLSRSTGDTCRSPSANQAGRRGPPAHSGPG